MQQQQQHLPQRRHRKMLKDGSSEVWPQDAEAIFLDGLRDYWNSPWANFSRGRSRWRNQFLVDYLKKNGIDRSKKQVASHIQVLRNMWKGHPEFCLVAGPDELAEPQETTASRRHSPPRSSPTRRRSNTTASAPSTNSPPGTPGSNFSFDNSPPTNPSQPALSPSGLPALPPVPESAPSAHHLHLPFDIDGGMHIAFGMSHHHHTHPPPLDLDPPPPSFNRVTGLCLWADNMSPQFIDIDDLPLDSSSPSSSKSTESPSPLGIVRTSLRIRLTVPPPPPPPPSGLKNEKKVIASGFNGAIAFAAPIPTSSPDGTGVTAQCMTRVHVNSTCVFRETSPLIPISSSNASDMMQQQQQGQRYVALLPDSWLSRCATLIHSEAFDGSANGSASAGTGSTKKTIVTQQIHLDKEALFVVIYDLVPTSSSSLSNFSSSTARARSRSTSAIPSHSPQSTPTKANSLGPSTFGSGIGAAGMGMTTLTPSTSSSLSSPSTTSTGPKAELVLWNKHVEPPPPAPELLPLPLPMPLVDPMTGAGTQSTSSYHGLSTLHHGHGHGVPSMHRSVPPSLHRSMSHPHGASPYQQGTGGPTSSGTGGGVPQGRSHSLSMSARYDPLPSRYDGLSAANAYLYSTASAPTITSSQRGVQSQVQAQAQAQAAYQLHQQHHQQQQQGGISPAALHQRTSTSTLRDGLGPINSPRLNHTTNSPPLVAPAPIPIPSYSLTSSSSSAPMTSMDTSASTSTGVPSPPASFASVSPPLSASSQHPNFTFTSTSTSSGTANANGSANSSGNNSSTNSPGSVGSYRVDDPMNAYPPHLNHSHTHHVNSHSHVHSTSPPSSYMTPSGLVRGDMNVLLGSIGTPSSSSSSSSGVGLGLGNGNGMGGISTPPPLGFGSVGGGSVGGASAGGFGSANLSSNMNMNMNMAGDPWATSLLPLF